MDLEEGIIVGFGNPLLDITCLVEDLSLAEKFELPINAAIIAEPKHMTLFDELANMENVKYTAAGACQNSLRIFQWIVGDKNRAVFYGAIGKDKFGDIMAKRVRADGIDAHYQIIENRQTGSCAVIVTDSNRSLVANLGAAGFFSEEFLDTEENVCIVDRASYFYVTGFFLAVAAPTVLRIANFACLNKKTFIFNISALFVLQTKKALLDELIPYIDLIICNKDEALTFADIHEWDSKDIFEIGRRLQQLPKNTYRSRIVLITSAACPILCFLENERVLQYPIPGIDEANVVDSNGCNDAFVGGFLAKFVQNMPLDYCIRTGIFASQQVLRIIGVEIGLLPQYFGNCI